MPTLKKRSIAAEDLYILQSLSDVRISPNGGHVVYRLQRVDKKTEKKYGNLWIVPTGDGEPCQFTFGDQSDSSPLWSPGGSSIAFLSNRENKEKPEQIFIIPFNGGEARKLTSIEGEINIVDWSSDGRKLLCTIRKTDAEVLEREKDEQKKKLGVVARHYDRLFYKLDGYGYLPHERTHIWLVDARTGKGKQLTDSPIHDETNPVFSPDGKSIAFTSNRSVEPDAHPDCDDIFIMPADGGAPRKLETPVGSKYMLSFSPDGKWLAYLGAEGENEGYKSTSLWVMPLDGSKPARNLTERYDLHAMADVITDYGSAETVPPVWSNDGKYIYFQAAIHGSTVLKRISMDGKEMTEIIGEGGALGTFSFDKAQKHLAYFYGLMQDTPQVHLREMDGTTIHYLTHINYDIFSSIKLPKVEEVWYKGADGTDLQGWIMFPPNFDPNKTYPSILEIHGGPWTQYGKFFMHEFNYFASNGYVVYFTNPRGGRGYGEKHSKAIWGAFGGADYDDLMAFTNLVAKKPYIDTKRMGVTGGSYGGFMTLWIVGHTNRFKSAVAQRSVTNWVSMWGSSDFNWIFQSWAKSGSPQEGMDRLWNMSPIKYLGEAKTPTLIIHNEHDHRCPIEQGEQAFVALKRAGVETEFVRFPEEPHGLSRTGRTDRRIARLNHILRWMDIHLK
jgi:dipeptidyl aminopeptidase/acylaminoacyl peptidase